MSYLYTFTPLHLYTFTPGIWWQWLPVSSFIVDIIPWYWFTKSGFNLQHWNKHLNHCFAFLKVVNLPRCGFTEQKQAALTTHTFICCRTSQYFAYDRDVIEYQDSDEILNNILWSWIKQSSEIFHADIHASVIIN